MRLKISLYSERKIVVPYGFSAYLQALIYSFLDGVSAEWLHENGFKYEKRRFKLFTFSSFLEKPEKNKLKKEFTFPNSVSFIISSPLEWLIKQVAKNISFAESVRIGRNNAVISGVQVLPEEKIDSSTLRINAIEPIEVHSTFKNEQGIKKTYYYSPTEKEFSKLINESQKKKWTSFFNRDCPYNLTIKPVRAEFCKKQVRRFKNIIIEGFTGHYFIEGEPEFLQFSLSTGLGNRNSGGFGIVEILKENFNV